MMYGLKNHTLSLLLQISLAPIFKEVYTIRRKNKTDSWKSGFVRLKMLANTRMSIANFTRRVPAKLYSGDK
jgi:hypothetical protein